MRENIDNRSPEEIESDIERTRADFSSTIDAIQQKLTPSELKNQAVDYALSTTPGAVSVGLVNMVRENPIPVAMIGIGFAWLLAASRQPTTYVAGTRRRAGRRGTSYPDMETSTYDSTFDTTSRGVRTDRVGRTSYSTGRGTSEGMLSRALSKVSETAQGLKSKASETAQELKSRASDTAQGLKSRAGDVSQRLSSTASDMGGRVQNAGQSARSRLHDTAQSSQVRMSEMGEMSKAQYYRTKESVSQMIDEQPLIVGALGIALGAALGATLPSTRRENELMGEARDNLLGKVKETALEQAEAVKQTAMQSVQRVTEVAKEEAARVKDDVSSSVMQGKDQQGSSSGTTGGTGTSSYGGLSGQQSIH
jgi:uncharacterized protein YjbJ (UPF0337 family)